MNIVNKDSKNTFTRMCIGEAVIRLLKDTDFDKIRITSVAKCAGVSRIKLFTNIINQSMMHYATILILLQLNIWKNVTATLKAGAFLIIHTSFLHLNSLTGIRIIFLLFRDVDFILF